MDARSLFGLVRERADLTPGALFAVDEHERQISFADYRDRAERVAAGLAARAVGVGTVVSWQLPTRLDALLLCAALARLGAVQNPILPSYRARELGIITRQTAARLLVVPGSWRGFDYAQMARELAREAPELDVLVADAGLPEADPSALPPLPEGDGDVRRIFYTSGTTADPKGARHSDASLRAAGDGLVRVLALEPDDRIGLVFPFTHVGGACWLIAGLVSGAAQILVETFHPEATPALLARHGVTQAGAGTVFHQAYLAAQRAAPERPLFPNVRAFPGGGAPKPSKLHDELKRELGGAGIVSGYGLTECPIIAMNAVGDPSEKLAHTEGKANPPDAEIRIVDGEIRVRGPQLCRGYVDASLDAAAFDEDGFFRTGDLGALDEDGFLIITGRRKDVIIRKGENISAKEVEDVLYTHPKVADVGVVGLPDPALGERCCAVVVCLRADDPLGFEEMVAFLKGQGLMIQKIPEQLEVVETLPRNASGKVLKAELRERYAQAGAAR